MITFVTILQRRMLPLRAAAIAANIFFIAYAAIGHFLPVLALHVSLLPVNCSYLLCLVFHRAPVSVISPIRDAG